MKLFRRVWSALCHKRGAQTVEYVAVMAGAALLGIILLTVMESEEIQSTLKEKIACVVTLECGESQNAFDSGGSSVNGNPSDLSGKKSPEEEGFFQMLGRKAGEAWDSFSEMVSDAWHETKDGLNYLWENAKQEVKYEVDGLKGATTFKEGLEYTIQTTLRLTPIAGVSTKLEKLTGFDLIGWVSENPGTALLTGTGVVLLFIPGGQGIGTTILGNILRTMGWGIVSGSAAGGLFAGLSGGDVSNGMLAGGLAGAVGGGVGAAAIRYGGSLVTQFLRSPWAQRWIPIGGSGAVAGGSEEATHALVQNGKMNWKRIIAAGLVGTIMGVGGGLFIEKVSPYVTQALQNRGILASADGTLSHPNLVGNAGDVAEDAADGYRKSQGGSAFKYATKGDINKSVSKTPFRKEDLYNNPEKVAHDLSMEFQEALPPGSKGRVTMSAAIVEDQNGQRFILLGTSEKRGYLRKGTKELAQKYELHGNIIVGTGHAEADIVKYAQQNKLKVITAGAGRPHCKECVKAIEEAGGTTASPRR